MSAIIEAANKALAETDASVEKCLTSLRNSTAPNDVEPIMDAVLLVAEIDAVGPELLADCLFMDSGPDQDKIAAVVVALAKHTTDLEKELKNHGVDISVIL